MGPKPSDPRSDHDLFRTELVNLIDQRHGTGQARRADRLAGFADEWSPQFV